MGYAVYEDRDARDYGVERWAGYGVPALCDWPDCEEEIHHGLAFKCEEHGGFGDDDEWESNNGCGLYFCEEHLYETGKHGAATPKPDTREWVEWMLTDESWEQWRAENPARVEKMKGASA